MPACFGIPLDQLNDLGHRNMTIGLIDAINGNCVVDTSSVNQSTNQPPYMIAFAIGAGHLPPLDKIEFLSRFATSDSILKFFP